MMSPSLSHSNSLAIATPSVAGRGDRRGRTFPRPFADLSNLGPRWAEGERRESSSAAGSSWSWTAGASSARWLQEWRRRLDEVHLRGLECFAEARLGISGPPLAQAEDCARPLIGVAPSPAVQSVHRRRLDERTTTSA